jgi:hypothetical protein
VLPITPTAALATGTGRCPATWVTPGAGRRPEDGAWAGDGTYWKTRLLVLGRADELAVPDRPAAGAVWPPATKMRPPRVKPVACASGTGSRPATVAWPVPGLTRWMVLVTPDRVCPPNTQIRDPSAATAGYRTGTGSLAATRNRRPPVVASTAESYFTPLYPPIR